MTILVDHLREVAAWLAATDIETLELSGPTGHVRLRRGEPGAGAAADAEPAGAAGEARRAKGALDMVRSPAVGLFLHAHPLRAEPFVRPGSRATAGQSVGLLRIGALLVPVAAPRDGVVAALIASNQSLVGFGDPLVELSPTSSGSPP